MNDNARFLSGPISSDPGYRVKFNNAAKYYERQGYVVLNPAVLPPGLNYEDYMDICRTMQDVCGVMAMLPGWEDSPGAVREYHHGKEIGQKILIAPQISIRYQEPLEA